MHREASTQSAAPFYSTGRICVVPFVNPHLFREEEEFSCAFNRFPGTVALFILRKCSISRQFVPKNVFAVVKELEGESLPYFENAARIAYKTTPR